MKRLLSTIVFAVLALLSSPSQAMSPIWSTIGSACVPSPIHIVNRSFHNKGAAVVVNLDEPGVALLAEAVFYCSVTAPRWHNANHHLAVVAKSPETSGADPTPALAVSRSFTKAEFFGVSAETGVETLVASVTATPSNAAHRTTSTLFPEPSGDLFHYVKVTMVSGGPFPQEQVLYGIYLAHCGVGEC